VYLENDIERVKAFHQIESYLDTETKELLIKKLKLENSNLEIRLPGLKIEDEFALMLHFFNNCKHIVSLDETTSVLTDDSYQSDFIVHFKNEKKMMVEVKSSKDNKFQIAKNNLEKRRQFSSDLGYELYIALRLRGYWMLFHSDYLMSNNYKIESHKDMDNSILLTELDASIYIIPKGVKVESIYSLTKNGGLGIRHGEYGELISIKLFYQDMLLFEVSSENKEHLPECLLFELWYDMLLEDVIFEKLDEVTVKSINELLDELMTLDFKYYLSLIKHTFNVNNRHESSSFLKLLASDIDVSLNKERVEILFSRLIELGIPIIVGKFMSNNTVIYQ
jgi:Holliday junction resolvase